MKNVFRTTALALAVALFGAGTAEAQQRPVPHVAPHVQVPQAAPQQQMRTPAQTKAALVQAAQRSNTPHFVAPNGKVVYNPHEPQHYAAIEPISHEGSGILQIMLSEGNQHTFGHFEGKYLHFQYIQGTNNWRMRPWADRLRPSNRRMFGAMIQLEPEEAANLRARLAGIMAEQGPEHLAGPQWEKGHVKEAAGVRWFNCASVWCEMPIGKNGESMAKVIGIPSSGDPFTLQRVLETGGNEKVVGIGLFGPKQPELGVDPNQRFAR